MPRRRVLAYGGGGTVLVRRVNYLWRLVITGLAFAAIGLGGCMLAFAAIPVATCPMHDSVLRARRAQHIIRASFRFYVTLLRLLGIIRLDMVGLDRLARCRGKLVIANHPTLLDVVLLMSLVRNAQCVVKHQLWHNPFLQPIVKAAGYIRNDQEPAAFIEACRTTLAAGNNLIIFPEGTRSVPGRPLQFQRGFAHIATLTGSDLQLVVITCAPLTLVKGQRWYHIPDRAPLYRIEIDEQVETGRFFATEARALGARKLVTYLESYYRGKLMHA